MVDYFDIIEHTRNKRLQEISTPGTENAPLLGECFENAYALALECYEQNLAPYIITGGLDFPRQPAPTTAQEAYELGQHHFWVVVDGTHLDICGEWLNTSMEGEPLISKTAPAHYITYAKSRFNPTKDDPTDYL